MKAQVDGACRAWRNAVVAGTLVFSAVAGRAQNVIAWGANSQGQTNVPVAATNVVAVAAGAFHSLALNPDGSVLAWGKNVDGQVDVPPSATNVVAVAAGAAHSLAVRDDGTVLAWGRNWDGQTDVPATATNVMSVSAGWAHSLALRADGTVVAWGNDEYGQTDFPFLALDVVAISAGYYHNMALRADGTVVTWALDYPTPASATNIVAVAAGWEHCLALRADGAVVAWGDNSYGQSTVPESATNVVSIAAGYYHNVALRADGTVISWGKSFFGVTNVPSPLTGAAAVAAGEDHSTVLLNTGVPRFWHQSASVAGHFGAPTVLCIGVTGTYPMTFQWLHDGAEVAGATNNYLVLRNTQSADAGSYVLIATNASGQAMSQPVALAVRQGPPTTGIGLWGDNVTGQCSVTSGVNEPCDPGARCDSSGVVIAPCAVAAGAFHCLALNTDGTVAAWGKNWDGQTIIPPNATNALAVAAGGGHSLALRGDGTIVAWGRNWDGQINVPPSATNIVGIAAGWAHSLALRADGTVVAWGNNDFGQTNVSFLALDVVAISAGYQHSMALRADGTVLTWGFDYPTPPDATNVIAIAAGWRHCLALRGDGSIVAWGDNFYGQTDVPETATNVVGIAAGYYHNLALGADGTVIAWGKNKFGVTEVPSGLRNVMSIAAGQDFNVALVAVGAPCVGRQLGSVQAHVGGTATLTANVLGTSVGAYQWFHDGNAVVGATNHFLTLTGSQPTDAGLYVLVALNAFGQASSQPVNLVVRPDPVTITSIGGWGDTAAGLCEVPPGATSPRAIAVGIAHALALNADRAVVGWGRNWDGQISVPFDATYATAIAAGGYHSLSLGSVHAWGRDTDGQTIVPPADSSYYPIAVAAGWAHSLALSSDGRVMAWGNNEFQQTNVPALSGPAVAIAAGYFHSLALLGDGSVVAWGLENTVPTSATNVVAVSGGWWHSLALRADGTVVAWGDNSHGQCNVPDSATNIVEISAGYSHNLAVRDDGSLLAWGEGCWGATDIPTGVHDVASVAAGQDVSLALVELGPPRFDPALALRKVHVGEKAILRAGVRGTHPLSLQWFHGGEPIEGATNRWLVLSGIQTGDAGVYTLVVTNGVGQTNAASASVSVLATPVITEVTAPQSLLVGKPASLTAKAFGEEPLSLQWQLNGQDLVDSAHISGSSSAVLYLDAARIEDSGTYSLIASNAYGSVTGTVAQISVNSVLAWGDSSVGQITVPLGTADFVMLAAGGDHSIGLRADDAIAAWGDHSSGQNDVPQPAGSVVAVADGNSHSLALRSDGTVVAWGDNTYGQTLVPDSATNVVAVAAGGAHSLALRLDGKVIAWGSDSGGQRTVPSFATNVIAIAAGDEYSLALRAGGTLVCWGRLPPPPATVTNVVAIAGGARHALALQADGALVAWGANYYGQTDVPASATNVVGIAAGGDHSLALFADGTVMGWGADHFGQASAPLSATNIIAVSAGSDHTLALVGNGMRRPAFQSFARAATIGQPIVLSAGSLAGAAADYQWQLNGIDLPGATAPVLSLPFITWTNAGTYRLVMSNALGRAVGPEITLTVLRTPLLFDTSPAELRINSGDLHLRLVGASGAGPVVIYATTDFQAWQPIFTNPPVIGSLEFTDPGVSNEPLRFYRAVEGEAPGPLRIEIPPETGSANIPLRLTGLTAKGPVLIYASSNLLDWQAIFTNPPTIGPLQYLEEPSAVQPRRFYRASESR